MAVASLHLETAELISRQVSLATQELSVNYLVRDMNMS